MNINLFTIIGIYLLILIIIFFVKTVYDNRWNIVRWIINKSTKIYNRHLEKEREKWIKEKAQSNIDRHIGWIKEMQKKYEDRKKERVELRTNI